MQTVRSRWRLLALMLPVALVIAAVAFFMGGSSNNNDTAFAGVPVDTSGITCTDVYLREFNALAASSKPVPIGDPPPYIAAPNILQLKTAMALTRSYHNSTLDQYFTGPVNATRGETQTISFNLAGIIAGNGTSLAPCARIDKVVAAVSSVTAEPGGAAPNRTAQVEVTATGGNPPLEGEVVYWDSALGTRKGYYVVTSVAGSTLDLLAMVGNQGDTDPNPGEPQDVCSDTPNPGSDLGSLWACIPDNKDLPTPVFSHGNTNTVVGGILDRSTARGSTGAFGCAGGGSPSAKACGSFFIPPGAAGSDCSTAGTGPGCSVSISCGPGTGPPEDPNDPVGQWTRLETRTTSYTLDADPKTPSYGVTQFFTPVDSKTCANITTTRRSTTYNVVWSLDSAEADGPDPVANNWNSDWDKDGCLDWQELAIPQPIVVAGGGGRDAFNPYDCGRTIDGDWDITVVPTQITTPNEGNTIVAGSFFRCRASITLPDARIYCYRDDPSIDVNPDNALGEKGDGYGGAIWPTGSQGLPPAPYGDVNEKHAVLTASYSSGTDTLSLSGCFEDLDGSNPEGHVYWRTSTATDISILTGYGEVDVWTGQTQGDCTTGSPAGAPTFDDADVFIGIQAGNTQPDKYADHYDQDRDGVPNSRELNDDAACGRRDPFNRYDYYDVSQPKDGVIDLPNDILGVILHFAPGGNPPYDANWDRPVGMTANSGHWNRAAPDGVIDLPNDILGVILQFNPAGCGL